ncbi:sodium:proton antiporter [Anaeromyxobacter oryzae]|uniref:Sodium:proton antiporter n=1 Tax=Anaeromyxobacter oryzae TaxID=2918170 RepID=A0ABM7WZ75_9BACT|nr:sodium:proton antiporter [Anaeromyxobacter oryzae]BDG04843.1 sodium:proton antiporter [Anaeromyxobacter oryzae]
MKKVLLYSVLLVAGLAGSQLLPALGDAERAAREVLRVATMAALGFVMIRVGLEFELDRTRPRALLVDYGVAATAAAFPWIFAAVYFVVVLGEPGAAGNLRAWSEALLAGRFAAPTSAGVLFAMLAAAGLGATWLYRKARVLAIFDDLDTVLFMIPLKMLLVGARWQLAVVVVVVVGLLAAGWRWMRSLRAPTSWPWLLGYAVAIALLSEAIHLASLRIDDVMGIHVEVLLPAFVLGVAIAHRPGADGATGHAESRADLRAADAVSGVFMVLVGLSMPVVDLGEQGAGALALHVLGVTALANLGKMFPVFCYRGEATLRERLALSIGMWPRGEVGAGVLVVSLGYGIGGPMVTVAALSLALNLLLTGGFIAVVKRLLASVPERVGVPAGTAPPLPRAAARR